MSSHPTLPRPPLGPRHWPVWLGVACLVALARLPWRLQQWLGRGLGRMLHVLMGQRRRVARRNLELCFPGVDAHARTQMLQAHFEALGVAVFEFARAWWGSAEPMRRLSRLEGLEHLRTPLAEGRGVILVSGHFTTLEICGRLLCDHVPAAAMYRPHRQPAMEWAVYRGRMRYAQAMFSKSDVRGAVRHLKRGGLLWYAPDQDPSRGDTVFVPFFGQPACTLTSTHQLARLSAAEVVLFTHARRADGGYDLAFSPIGGTFPSQDAVTDTARVLAGIEAMVRACPAQYLWIHRRFKRRPDGGNVYKDHT